MPLRQIGQPAFLRRFPCQEIEPIWPDWLMPVFRSTRGGGPVFFYRGRCGRVLLPSWDRLRLTVPSFKSRLLAWYCFRLSLSLLHEDRMRLSIKIKRACFSTFDFHYLCTRKTNQSQRYYGRNRNGTDPRGEKGLALR